MRDYRCSCCNEIKPIHNLVYKKWDALKKKENCTIVCICRGCNMKMRKLNIDRVETYKKRK